MIELTTLFGRDFRVVIYFTRRLILRSWLQLMRQNILLYDNYHYLRSSLACLVLYSLLVLASAYIWLDQFV